jgi:hypothetical protein
MNNWHVRGLVLSVVIGCLAGMVNSSVLNSGVALPSDVVADVNGSSIRLVDYSRTLDAVASDKRTSVDDTDRRFILRRLIEEELLVQEGLNQGLLNTDQRVRQLVVDTMQDSIVANLELVEPTRADIEAVYQRLSRQYSDKSVPELASLQPSIVSFLREEQQGKALQEYILWLREQANVKYTTGGGS